SGSRTPSWRGGSGSCSRGSVVVGPSSRSGRYSDSMRVYEVAREFAIEPEKMLQLLRGMGVRATSEASAVDDATIAKLRARMERERRAGHTDVEETLEAVVEDVQTTTTKRRRRKKEDLPEPAAEDSTASPMADAAEAIAAEAAEAEEIAAEEPALVEAAAPTAPEPEPEPEAEPEVAAPEPIVAEATEAAVLEAEPAQEPEQPQAELPAE